MPEDEFVQLDATTWVRPERVDGYQKKTGRMRCAVLVQGVYLDVDCSLEDLRKALHGPAEPDLGVGGVLDLATITDEQAETLGKEVGLNPPRRDKMHPVSVVQPPRDSRDGWWLTDGVASSSDARWQLRLYNQPGPGFQVVAMVKGSENYPFPAYKGEHYALKQEGVR